MRRKSKMAKKTFNIVTLPGDGIGPDIVKQAVKVINRIGEIYGYTFNITETDLVVNTSKYTEQW
jgi:isocitrate/isopropylmalate dehydrogenase